MPSRKDFFAKIKKIEDYDGWFHQQPLSTVSQAVVEIFAAEEGPKKTFDDDLCSSSFFLLSRVSMKRT